jgi:hypothetical protein
VSVAAFLLLLTFAPSIFVKFALFNYERMGVCALVSYIHPTVEICCVFTKLIFHFFVVITSSLLPPTRNVHFFYHLFVAVFFFFSRGNKISRIKHFRN